MVRIAVFALNRCSTNALKKKVTLAEVWFGCSGLVYVPTIHRSKLDESAEEMVFMGYCRSGYNLGLPEGGDRHK